MNPAVELSDFSFFELSAGASSKKFQFNQSSEKVSVSRIILISHLQPGAPWLAALASMQIKITYHWTSGEAQAVLLNPLLWVSAVQLHPIFTGFDLPATQTIGFSSQNNKRIEAMTIELILKDAPALEDKPVLQFAYKAPPVITMVED